MSRSRKLAFVSCALLAACCAARGGNPQTPRATGHLDLTHSLFELPRAAELGDPEHAKFVEVELAELVNPKRVPISFELRLQPPGGDKELLGTFAPFPADRPGTFIVATQGKLSRESKLFLSLVPLAKTRAGDELRVTVKLALRAE